MMEALMETYPASPEEAFDRARPVFTGQPLWGSLTPAEAAARQREQILVVLHVGRPHDATCPTCRVITSSLQPGCLCDRGLR